ncbi:MAG TPA: septation protein SepH [Jatrophihabitans sp.]|jgi:hypothetical protein
MRTLHVVGNTEAGKVVLETSDGLEQFELPIDSALRSALADAPRISPKPVARTAEPQITPREIQTRVRAGEPPREVAEESGAELDWVLRFAGPVLAERARIADEARRAKARRSTTEGQIVVFGEAVDERFAAHGIDPASVDWDAYRREDGQWVLLAHWIGGQAERTAEWAFQLSSRSVAPVDDTAADLLSDRPIRPIAPPPDPEPATPTLTLAPPLAPGLVAFPAMPDAHTGKLPRTEEEVFDQTQFEEPPLPMDVPNAAEPEKPRRVEESEEDKAARAAIPSWDDILLGVRRKRD